MILLKAVKLTFKGVRTSFKIAIVDLNKSYDKALTSTENPKSKVRT